MFITTDILRKHKACEQGIEYIQQFYPNGAEMLEIIQNHHTPKEMLHWGREHLTHTEEELVAYFTACEIVNSEGLWYSQRVCDSKYVVKSQDVKTSTYVFDSTDITDSIDVVNSENVLNCKQIFHSSMIDDSEKIFRGQNITNSINICNSTMVLNSKNVIDSFSVFDSSEIIRGTNISNSYFCQDCKDIKHCIFCENLKDAEYCIFNKPVDKKYFEVFEKQYLKYLTELLDFIRDWPTETFTSARIAPTRKFDDWYHPVSDRFWKWARTLPNFDSTILYNITLIPDFL